MVTKKDLNRIAAEFRLFRANVVSGEEEEDTLDRLANCLGLAFLESNPRVDLKRFESECKLGWVFDVRDKDGKRPEVGEVDTTQPGRKPKYNFPVKVADIGDALGTMEGYLKTIVLPTETHGGLSWRWYGERENKLREEGYLEIPLWEIGYGASPYRMVIERQKPNPNS
jgi:hypothetical protein